MSLQNTPVSERLRIGFFGMRNAGKSSLINAITGQQVSVVSEVKGTTTDPVQKTMELLPLGPVVITDTAGMDDTGDLGTLRMEKTREILRKTDIAVLVVDAEIGLQETDQALIEAFERLHIPFLTVYHKADLISQQHSDRLYVSSKTGAGIEELKARIGALRTEEPQRPLIQDLLKPGDLLVLVTPIDASAPKGRLILPQQQTIRAILDANAACVVVKETEYAQMLQKLPAPRMVITDSQVFSKVAAETPDEIPLTSFSILMARYKGFLEEALKGVSALRRLKTGDRVLIAEGCTHHRQCNDIGTVQIPKKIRAYTGAEPEFVFSSGNSFPQEQAFQLIVHCGGCMLSQRELRSRIAQASASDIPITNYGVLLAECAGIFDRAVKALLEI